VNRDEAKKILLRSRPGTPDYSEPEVAEALALARSDRELTAWLEEHTAGQRLVRKYFRHIPVPAGLKEQIIAEHRIAQRRKNSWRYVLAGLSATIILFCSIAVFRQMAWERDDTMDVFRQQMAGVALRGYGMDLTTNDTAAVRSYLAQNNCPANFPLPAGLQKARLTGCSVEGWQNGKVALLCFHTGKPLPAGQTSDLWLFVADWKSIHGAPSTDAPQLLVENHLITAAWSDGEKVYLLEMEGTEADLRKYL
jgi:hypothetical protein